MRKVHCGSRFNLLWIDWIVRLGAWWYHIKRLVVLEAEKKIYVFILFKFEIMCVTESGICIKEKIGFILYIWIKVCIPFKPLTEGCYPCSPNSLFPVRSPGPQWRKLIKLVVCVIEGEIVILWADPRSDRADNLAVSLDSFDTEVCFN